MEGTMKIAGMLCVAAIALSGAAWALDDTKENRVEQAGRYSAAVPLSELLKDVVDKGATNLPPERREKFRALFNKHLDLPALEVTVQGILVKHFTADELKALADFYGSPVGKSAMKKFGTYMADAMPVIQAEMSKAQTQASRELKNASD